MGLRAHPVNQDKNKDGEWRSQFMDAEGFGSLDTNQAVDGTDILTYPDGYAAFKVTAPPGWSYFIGRMVGVVEVDGQFTSGGYGTGPALTTGCQLWRCSPTRGDYQWTYQHAISSNVDYGHYAYDVNVTEWSNQYQTLLWRYTITKDAVGGTFWLRENESLCMRIYDDLASRCATQHIRLGFIAVNNTTIYT